jgi:hypothetical protein
MNYGADTEQLQYDADIAGMIFWATGKKRARNCQKYNNSEGCPDAPPPQNPE